MKIWLYIVLVSFCFTKEDGYIDSTKIRDPKLAWKLGFVPGLGQIYNGKYIKAVGFISSEYYAVSKFIYYKSGDKSIGLRNTYGWWIFGLLVWNILDSYVDSHLSTFPIRKLESSMSSDSLNVGYK